jgi:hypothetical protein
VLTYALGKGVPLLLQLRTLRLLLVIRHRCPLMPNPASSLIAGHRFEAGMLFLPPHDLEFVWEAECTMTTFLSEF